MTFDCQQDQLVARKCFLTIVCNSVANEQPITRFGEQASIPMERIGLSLRATVRERARNRIPVKVIDISIGGCRIEFLGVPFAEDSLWITIEGCESLPARVKWQKDGFAGLQFMALFSDAVLTRLLAQNAKSTEEVNSELREIAKRARLLDKASEGEEGQQVRTFSRDCSLRAILHALRLGELQTAQRAAGQLSSALIRRSTPETSDSHAG